MKTNPKQTPPETKQEAFRRIARKTADAKQEVATDTAEMIKLSLDIYREKLAAAFPDVPMKRMGVATLKTIDDGKLCDEAIASFVREGHAPVAIHYDPMRYVVVLIYEYTKRVKKSG